jgi:hypothetical protein
MKGMLSSMRCLPILLLLTGCEDLLGKDPNFDGYSEEVCTSAGIATVNIDISSAESAFLITADGDHLVAVEEIRSPSGTVLHWEDWYTANTYLTSGIWPLSSEMVLNWPIRGEEADLKAGTWDVDLAAVDSSGHYKNGSCISVTVQTKEDDDFGRGTVNVHLVYAEGVGSIEEVTTAVDAAIERWTDIWAPLGLTPVVRQSSGTIDPDLPYAGDGSEDIYDVTMDSYEDEITLIMGETIDGSNDFYGVAGSIPGTMTATTRSAVVMGWIANAGLDGSFSELDINIMGETMAHEIGHYMGLFHPVEQTFDAWDACDDTPDCTSSSTCDDVLGSNLMYPYPVCDMSGCVEQGDLSDIQGEILHRYTGAL